MTEQLTEVEARKASVQDLGAVTDVMRSLAAMRLIPKCELHVFYDCGHWAMIERKDEFESTVLAFLARDRKE